MDAVKDVDMLKVSVSSHEAALINAEHAMPGLPAGSL
jgi:hypothetical protein